MNFKIFICTLLIICTFCLCSCSDNTQPSSGTSGSAGASPSADTGDVLDGGLPVAVVNGKVITRDQWLAVYENYYYMLTYYYGVDPSTEEGAKIMEEYKNYALDSVITQQLMAEQAEKDGYLQYTQAQQDEAAEYVDKNISDSITQREEQLRAQYEGDQEVDFAAQAKQEIEKEMAEAGYTRQTLIEDKLLSDALDSYYQAIIAKASVTDEDINEYYNKLVTEQMAYSAQQFTSLYNGSAEGILCYIPEGYMLAQHILIGFDDEDASNVISLYSALYSAEQAVSAKQAELDSNTDQDKKADLQAELNELNSKLNKAQQDYNTSLSAASEKIKATVEDIYEQVKGANGDKFEEVALDVSSDAQGSKELNSYLIGEGDGLIAEFHSAALALKTDGEISNPVLGPYGYHIIRRVNALSAGSVDISKVKEEISTLLLQNAQEKLFEETILAWREQSNPTIFKENMGYTLAE